ncbi:hypothetical protein B0H67DRAFT_614098 [Lasiosphaeris hirsuta]|uniref:Uncharacterized protein n=1 Tax=Lasiosphaeris hirsuta TaxID=260670 RepID=A0AA40DIP1_9PEZI|nr:hypothetical protein B0H67DRAFT_614098 [Lasiosphaeris hirsuta]
MSSSKVIELHMFVASLILAFINIKTLQSEQHPCEPYFLGQNLDQYAVVNADLTHPSSAAEAAVALEISFEMALWIALAIHAVGVEIYLHLTPAEAERIRQVSYKRQLEAGMRKPGPAGITSDRFGNAKPWTPDEKGHTPVTLQESHSAQ